MWLVLALMDQSGLFVESVHTIAERPPDLDPFVQMIVTDGTVTRAVRRVA